MWQCQKCISKPFLFYMNFELPIDNDQYKFVYTNFWQGDYMTTIS